MFLCTLYPNLYAQDSSLKRDSLPVFVIQNRELESFIDGFITEAGKIDCDIPTVYNININLEDVGLTDGVHFLLDRRKLNEGLDSLTFYKNPHSHQAFIRHRGVFFRANIRSYAVSFNYHLLTEMIKALPEKQAVYFKNPPSGFYDLNLRGGYPFEDTLLDSSYEYNGKEWFCGIRPYEDDTEYEWIIEEKSNSIE